MHGLQAFYNDIDPYCCAVTARHVAAGDLPAGAVVCRDVREVTVDELRDYTQWHLFCGIGGIPYGLRLGGWPDAWPILTAGFPCQPTSLAGKRLAQADPRWLWPEVIRLVRGLRPPVVLLENPPGLLVRGFGDVLGDLAAAGYDASWRVLAAADVGAPHRRDRVWVVAYPQSGRRALWATPAAGPGRLAGDRVALADAAGARQPRPPLGPEHLQRPSPRSARPGDGRDAVADAQGDPEWPGLRPGRAIRVRGRRLGDRGGWRVADACGAGLPEPEPQRQPGRPVAECGGQPAESGLGGVPDGLPRGVDGHRWPAGRGAPQAPWEPPRTATGIPHRVPRLKALGNAVVPQVVAALVPWMVAEDQGEESGSRREGWRWMRRPRRDGQP